MTNIKISSGTKRRQSGFTLVEVLVSMVVLTVGLMSMLAMFSVALAATSTTQQDMLARQLAEEALESIFTARNNGQITFDQVNNVSNGGVFMDGPQVVQDAGPDGIDGTADDTNLNAAQPQCPGLAKCIPLPGKDGILNSNSGPNQWRSLSDFTRTIAITPLVLPPAQGVGVDSSLRNLSITITYNGQGKARTYVVGGVISQYR